MIGLYPPKNQMRQRPPYRGEAFNVFGQGIPLEDSRLLHPRNDDWSSPWVPRTQTPYEQMVSKSLLQAQNTLSYALRELVSNEAKGLSTKFRQRVEKLYDLPFDWDGEQASPVNHEILRTAVRVLKRLQNEATGFHEPFLVPTFDGFLQLDWHNNSRSLEVELRDDTWAFCGGELQANQEREYRTFEARPDSFEVLLSCFNWLVNARSSWPNVFR